MHGTQLVEHLIGHVNAVKTKDDQIAHCISSMLLEHGRDA
jgi:hypothetical protein